MECSRKIIYFSVYRNGIKAEPMGHAVLWQNGMACRLEYHCRLTDGDIVTPVYYFKGGASIVGEPMCSVAAGNRAGSAMPDTLGTVAYCVKTGAEHFLGSEKKASELEAICFRGTPMEYSGGRLDGKELCYANGEEEPHPAQVWMDTIAETARNGEVPQEASKWQGQKKPRQQSLAEPQGQRKLQWQRKPPDQKAQEKPQRQKSPKEAPSWRTDMGDTQNAPQEAFQNAKALEAASYTFPELFAALPKLSLPPYGIRRQCCRMELSDLEKLPKKWRGLEKNHFLLHGYYQYRHLLLVQVYGAQGEQYAVGVPGEFRYRDQYMAETFGFSAFYPLKKGNRRCGEFGYWYLYLT